MEQNEQVRAQPRLATIGMMLSPEHGLRLVIAFRIRQLVEILEQRVAPASRRTSSWSADMRSPESSASPCPS